MRNGFAIAGTRYTIIDTKYTIPNTIQTMPSVNYTISNTKYKEISMNTLFYGNFCSKIAHFLVKIFSLKKRQEKCQIWGVSVVCTAFNLPHFNQITTLVKMASSSASAKQCQMLWSWRENILRSKLAENVYSKEDLASHSELDHIHHDFPFKYHPNAILDLSHCQNRRSKVLPNFL